VEGLSIAAITYYGAGLVGYLADGMSAAGVHVDHKIDGRRRAGRRARVAWNET
jgi:uncharacterized membrane-anchored protein